MGRYGGVERHVSELPTLPYSDKRVDESDPDTNLSQIAHAFQTAEAARKDNQPRWMQATCLIHDLGKVWLLFYPNFQGSVSQYHLFLT